MRETKLGSENSQRMLLPMRGSQLDVSIAKTSSDWLICAITLKILALTFGNSLEGGNRHQILPGQVIYT